MVRHRIGCMSKERHLEVDCFNKEMKDKRCLVITFLKVNEEEVEVHCYCGFIGRPKLEGGFRSDRIGSEIYDTWFSEVLFGVRRIHEKLVILL